MTQVEGLTQALVLAITASDDDRARQAVELAEAFAAGCTKDEIKQAKREAARRVS